MARLQQQRPLTGAAVGLLTVGLLGIVAVVIVANESSRFLSSSTAGGGAAGLSVQQLRSRVLREPELQLQLWRLARASETLREFEAALQDNGLLLVAPQDKGGGSGSGGDSAAVGRAQRPAGGIAASNVPQLSHELAHAQAKDNIIIVTWANFHFHDFALNWARNLRQQGIHNFLVGAMDLETAQALSEHDLPVFAMFDTEKETSTGLTTGDFVWGSPTFHKMGRQKVELARIFTAFGLDLCLCDVDTVWINDPTSYFEQYPAADILASSDQLLPTLEPGDTGLENPRAIHSALNIGLLYFRHSANTTAFLEGWMKSLESDEKVWDQNAFNWLVHEGLVPFESHPSDERLVWAYKRSVVVGILPVASFASGHTFFVQKLFQVQQVQPYVVHTTFQYGGTRGKRHRMREAMLWVDEPAYYSEGKFLSVDLELPSVPHDFDHWPNTKMIQYHLDGMALQLRQMRAAFGLAVALNRTLIMPKLLCFCDRYWGPVERCRVPGATATRLPFVCPMDHIFEPYHFDNDPGKAGPPVAFREYSFLENEHTPSSIKAGRIVIMPKKGLKGVEIAAARKEAVFPADSTGEQLETMLAAVQDAPLLHVARLQGAFGGFADQGRRDKFRQRLASMAGFWCCRPVKEGEEGGQPYVQLMLPGARR